MTPQERQQWEHAKTVRLRVSFQEALNRLEGIAHNKFQSALGRHWQTDRNGNATVPSKCWLFCWAATGHPNLNTAARARTIFNEIFDRDYTWFDAHVGHEAAQKFRYCEP